MNASTSHRGITASVIAVMVVAGAGYLDWYVLQMVLTGTYPKAGNGDSTLLTMIVTAWNGITAMVCQYFFGNSANSDRKTELLASSSPAQTTTATTAAATIKTEPATAQP